MTAPAPAPALALAAHSFAAHPVTAATGVGAMLAHPFMREALLASIPIAALTGVVGYFMVLRS
jgi:ABC-type Mn2+/Zn2+ transport system permease subunit